MPITLNHSNINVQYETGKNYNIETVKSDLYLRDSRTGISSNLTGEPVVNPYVIVSDYYYPRTPSTNSNTWNDNGYTMNVKVSDAEINSSYVYFLFNHIITSADHYHSQQSYTGTGNTYTGATRFKTFAGIAIGVDYGRSIYPKRMRIAPRPADIYGTASSFLNGAPKAFKIFASDDAACWNDNNHSSWTQIHDQTTGLTYTNEQYTIVNLTANLPKYRYYTMVVLSTIGNYGGGYMMIAEWNMGGDEKIDPVPEGTPTITHKRLNFAYDLTKYTEYLAQLKTGVGGWRIVRYLPPNLGRWYQGNYINSTGFTIPTIGTTYNYTNEWAVPFGTFDEMFFGTFDMTYWLRCLKTSVLGTYDNALRPIISSSSSSTPYSARWYLRDGSAHEPWISITDHNSNPQTIVYGENSESGSGNFRNDYGGMCVLVRDSTAATTIPNPNTYTLNFPVPTLTDINNNSNIVLQGAYDIVLQSTNSSIIPKNNQYIPLPTTFTGESAERMYPPVRNFTADTTTISGQTYGNGTYIITGSSFYSSSEGGFYNLFNGTNIGWVEGGSSSYDGSSGTFTGSLSFEGFPGEWIKIQLPVSIKLTKYIIEAASIGGVSRAPSIYKIFGSNDNTVWKEVVYKSVALVSSNYVSNKFEEIVYSNDYYKYFVLVTSKIIGGDVRVSIGELSIYGKEQVSNPLSISYSLLNPILDPTGAQWTYSSNNTNVYHMGSVGIGTTIPSYNLDVRGTIFSSTGGYTQTGLTTWSITSDSRIKENIVKASYDKCLENVKNIELYNFNFKDNYVNTNDRRQLGFIAQEVQQVYPKAVEVGKMILNLEEKIDDLLTLNTTQIDYTLYGAVKGLIHKMDNIKTKMEQIKATSNITTRT